MILFKVGVRGEAKRESTTLPANTSPKTQEHGEEQSSPRCSF